MKHLVIIFITLISIVVTSCGGSPKTSEQTDTQQNYSKQEITRQESGQERIIGSYKFGESLRNWTITFNEDGTCTLFSDDHQDYLWHGAWEYHEWSDGNCYSINWSSCDNPYLQNLPFTGTFNYVDNDISFIYADLTSMKSKDPNSRYDLKR